MRDLLAAAAILVGLCFMFVASLGQLRFPDFFMRVHAPTKAATLGLFALVAALLIAEPDARPIESLLAGSFIGVTIPLSAHFLLRGAYRSGLRPEETQVDEYAGAAPPPRAPEPEHHGSD